MRARRNCIALARALRRAARHADRAGRAAPAAAEDAEIAHRRVDRAQDLHRRRNHRRLLQGHLRRRIPCRRRRRPHPQIRRPGPGLCRQPRQARPQRAGRRGRRRHPRAHPRSRHRHDRQARRRPDRRVAGARPRPRAARSARSTASIARAASSARSSRNACPVSARTRARGSCIPTCIIVADAGEFVFYDCIYEELLQSLGPINDDTTVPWTMFNDDVQMGFFDLYDQYLLNILYDRAHPARHDARARSRRCCRRCCRRSAPGWMGITARSRRHAVIPAAGSDSSKLDPYGSAPARMTARSSAPRAAESSSSPPARRAA